jgi:glycosyltransferase involved in cell wall biosynthesis
MSKRRFYIVATTKYAVDRFMLNSLEALSSDYDIFLINGETNVPISLRNSIIHTIKIPLKRKIHLLYDFTALLFLIKIFLSNKPHIVQSFTPKGGLLAMIAGFPFNFLRIHYFTGQVWVSKNGPIRILLMNLDRLTFRLSSFCLVDSKSQYEFLLQKRIISQGKAFVIGNGSLGGVDTQRFSPNESFRRTFRMKLGIPLDAYVILYMARLTIDKGALIVAKSFKEYKRIGGKGILFLVGPDEEHLIPILTEELGGSIDSAYFFGFANKPEDFFRASDVFFLPSLREGFGLVYVQAASCGLPTLGSKIYGTIDSIDFPNTGFVSDVGDVSDFARNLLELEKNTLLREKMGLNGRKRVMDKFDHNSFTKAYIDLLNQHL